MVTEVKPTRDVPWYVRGKGWIIGAGALAAALAAILSLGDRLFPGDPEDVARIDSVAMVGQTSFKEFAAKSFGVDFPLEPAAAAGAGAGMTVRLVSGTDPVAPEVQPTAPPVVETPVSPEVITPTDPPVVIPPETPATVEPTTPPSTTTPPPTPEATDPAFMELGPMHWSPPAEYLEVMRAAPQIEDWDLDEAELKVSFLIVTQPSGENGEELPPEEAAARVAAALADVESTTDEEGKLDPAGWTVAVNLTLEGLADVPLLLTWSLDGVDVPDEWAAEKVTYRVVAGTPRDSGTAEIWVPHLKTAGEYNVIVKLKLAEDRTTTVTQGLPLQITIP